MTVVLALISALLVALIALCLWGISTMDKEMEGY